MTLRAPARAIAARPAAAHRVIALPAAPAPATTAPALHRRAAALRTAALRAAVPRAPATAQAPAIRAPRAAAAVTKEGMVGSEEWDNTRLRRECAATETCISQGVAAEYIHFVNLYQFRLIKILIQESKLYTIFLLLCDRPSFMIQRVFE